MIICMAHVDSFFHLYTFPVYSQTRSSCSPDCFAVRLLVDLSQTRTSCSLDCFAVRLLVDQHIKKQMSLRAACFFMCWSHYTKFCITWQLVWRHRHS